MIVWEITGFSEGGIAIIAAETTDEAQDILWESLGGAEAEPWGPHWTKWTVKPWGGVLIVTVGKP